MSGVLETEVRDSFMQTGTLKMVWIKHGGGFTSEVVSLAFLWTNSRTYRYNLGSCESYKLQSLRYFAGRNVHESVSGLMDMIEGRRKYMSVNI